MAAARNLLAEYRLQVLHGVTAIADAILSHLAGDWAEAETILSQASRELEQAGENGYRSTVLALLAMTLCAQERYSEAETLATESAAITAPDDAVSLALLPAIRALLAARKGQTDTMQLEAEQAARIAADTDSPDQPRHRLHTHRPSPPTSGRPPPRPRSRNKSPHVLPGQRRCCRHRKHDRVARRTPRTRSPDQAPLAQPQRPTRSTQRAAAWAMRASLIRGGVDAKSRVHTLPLLQTDQRAKAYRYPSARLRSGARRVTLSPRLLEAPGGWRSGSTRLLRDFTDARQRFRGCAPLIAGRGSSARRAAAAAAGRGSDFRPRGRRWRR